MDFASQNILYVVVALGFMIPAEKLLRKFFGFNKADTPGLLAGPAGAAATTATGAAATAGPTTATAATAASGTADDAVCPADSAVHAE